MGRLRISFRGLRWKLTLSYTLVTVAALVAVQVIAVAGVWVVISNSNLFPGVLISVVKIFIVPPITSYLDNPEPDLQGLTSWLRAAATSEGLTFQSPEYPNLQVTFGDRDQNTTLLVLDENLDFIDGIPEPDEETLKRIFNEAGGVLAAAQAGDEKPERIYQISPEQGLTIAVPVTSDTGALLGVVAFRVAYPPVGLLIELLSLIGVSIIVLTVAAGIIGTVFGYFTARGLTRRLDNITQTTDAWGQGDFSAFIDDRSDDELGQLAQRFNRMAEQMQNLLQTRHELATVEERNRLARDLHDSVKQQVFAIAMQVGAARSLLDQDSTAALEHLNEAEQLSRQAQTELAAIIRELQPATLQGRGFAQALKEYVADWSRQNKIAAEVRMQGELSLPLEAERTLFRVFQEALSNIAWHSGATHIDVQLVCEINEVSLVIADNGKGFDITAVEGTGVGLRSMRERMEALDGSLSLESIPGQGTRLIARLLLTRGVPQ